MEQEKKKKKLTLRAAFWSMFGLGVLSLFLLFFLTGLGVFGKLPTFKELENPDLAVATEVYSADGEMLGKIYRQNRVNVGYDQLPKHLVDAVISTEDERFRKHSGIDLKSTIRAFAFLGKRGGGSTITQQLAKNLLEQGRDKRTIKALPKRIIEKVKEYIVATRLEKRYTKEEILAMYLNQFEFVNNAIGIQSASKVYFSKSVQELDTLEAAVFAGMLKNPSAFNPKQNPNDSKARRNVVFRQMAKNNHLTKEEKEALQAQETIVRFQKDDHNSGLAPYLRSVIQNDVLKRWINDNPKMDGQKYDMYRDGLKIYTTVDSRLQAIAEKAVEGHLAELQKDFDKQNKRRDPWKAKLAKQALENAISNTDFYQNRRRKGVSREKIVEEMEKPVNMSIYHPVKGEVDTLMSRLDSIKYHRLMLQSAFVVVQPNTGHVKAWVGGRNFKYFKLDRVINQYDKPVVRQVGSTFKPFLYTVALDNGWAPCFTVPNFPVSIQTATGDVWTPKNSDTDEFDGRPITLKEGLARSKNTISAYLIKEIGPKPVVNFVERLGLNDVPEVYSIALGTTDQSVLSMAKAYTAYANSGVATEPIMITRIEDKNGNVLANFVPEQVEAMSPELAYSMLQMMRGVVTSGTATRLGWKYGINNFVAGKTGTTDDHSDGWFVGLTPDLVGVVWTGCDDPVLRFTSLRYGSGSNMALPVWGRFFKDAYALENSGVSKASTFKQPNSLSINMNCDPVLQDGQSVIIDEEGNTVIVNESGNPPTNPNSATNTTGGVLDPDSEEEDFQ